ncbi:hypothetical protein HNV08_00500 [Winogradskyella eckloniae]|uniref:hypothetical protein n=1 Tax=Winogradskyella eckloniae TaxID=1089306 RepID=UPI001565D8B4|nr:hypothetical protein [Winogradskyella eckloniae]NRD18509.1 hypothetical protein [Winogradskyella eckloniae]
MNLTKQEIQFIDNYLIKNEVKFWDVRIELLDHIVSAVEDKMTNDGISFNEALLDVHRSFGNQFIEFGVSKDKIFEKGLYQSNAGFKKFIRNKQKEIGRKHRKAYWKTFVPFITSIRFFVELLLLAIVTFVAYQYSIKAGLFAIMSGIFISEFTKLFYGGLKKFKSKSLNIQSAVASSLLLTQLPYWLIMLFNWNFENAEVKPYYILFCLFALLFVFSRHSVNNFIKIYNTYNERYKLLIS